MILSDKGLDKIEHQADKNKNVNLMFLVQILREVREVKSLLEIHQNAGNCGYNCTSGTNNGKNKHG